MSIGTIIGFIISVATDIWSHSFANKILKWIVSIGGAVAGAFVGVIVDNKSKKHDPLWYRENRGK